MTIEKKLEMYKGKKAFIDSLHNILTPVESIRYEVYKKEVNENITDFIEYLVVTFSNGFKSVRAVTGNSNSANFRELGNLVHNSYADENSYYDSLASLGYELLAL